MAQDTSGTNLETAWEDTDRTIACTVEMQWDGTNWVDETSRVASLTISASLINERFGLPMLGTTPPDRATLVVDNNDNRFSPDTSGSQANTYYSSGIWDLPVRISMGFYDGASAETLRQFTGRIYQAIEQEATGSKRVTLQCWDESAPLRQYKRTTSMTTDQRPDEMIETELTAASVASYTLDYGLAVIPWVWLDDENMWEEMVEVAGADGGWVRATKAGEIVFERMTHWLEGTDHTSSQATLNRARVWLLSDEIGHKDLYDEVVVECAPRSAATLDTIYSARDVIEVPPDETISRTCRYDTPASSIKSPVANTDYTALRAGGVDASSDLTVSATAYAAVAEVDFTNGDSNHPIWVLNFKLRGYPVQGEEAQEVKATSAAGEIGTTKRYRLSGNDYIQTYAQASRLASFLSDRLGRYRRYWGFECTGCPWLELGDRVTVTSSDVGIDADGYLVQYEHSWAADQMWRMSGIVLPAANLFAHTDYFIIDSSTLADSGSDKVFY